LVTFSNVTIAELEGAGGGACRCPLRTAVPTSVC
jgi:hypothetical protein